MFQKVIPFTILLALWIHICGADITVRSPKVGKRVELKFKTVPNTIIRPVKNQDSVIYYLTVCNGSNKAKCGYWYDPLTGKNNTKKGLPTYNKNKNMLIIPKIVMGETGSYATDLPENPIYYLNVVKK